MITKAPWAMWHVGMPLWWMSRGPECVKARARSSSRMLALIAAVVWFVPSIRTRLRQMLGTDRRQRHSVTKCSIMHSSATDSRVVSRQCDDAGSASPVVMCRSARADVGRAFGSRRI